MKNFFLKLALMALLVVDTIAHAVEQALVSVGQRVELALFRWLLRSGQALTVTYYSDMQTTINGPASGLAPATRVRTTKLGGRLRLLESTIISPAATLLVGDKIVWGKLPLKSVLVGHLSKLIWTAGAASSTLTLGDNVVNARHLAATSITAAGSAVPTASEQVNTGTLTTVAGSNVAVVASSPGSYRVGNLLSGTGINAGTFITGISGSGIGALLTLSQNATASGTNTITSTGDGYEVSDDSNSVANGYGSATDDASLISVVAGAAAPANQVITLKAVYIQD